MLAFLTGKTFGLNHKKERKKERKKEMFNFKKWIN